MTKQVFSDAKQLWQRYRQEWNVMLEKEKIILDSITEALDLLDSGHLTMEIYDQSTTLFRQAYNHLRETSFRKIDMFSSAFEKMGYDDEEIEEQPEVNKE